MILCKNKWQFDISCKLIFLVIEIFIFGNFAKSVPTLLNIYFIYFCVNPLAFGGFYYFNVKNHVRIVYLKIYILIILLYVWTPSQNVKKHGKVATDDGIFVIIFLCFHQILYCSSWKNPQCPFRTDKRTKLMVIPTILKWNGVQRLEGSQCTKPQLLEMMFEDE